MEKVKPICIVCRKPFKNNDIVQVAKLFDQFTHFHCCDMVKNEIKEIGKFGEVVTLNKKYKKMYLIK